VNIAHTKENATARSLKPEWWDAPLVKGKEHQEKPVLRDSDDDDSNAGSTLPIIVMKDIPE
jgi:hypothetical protein